MRQIKIGQSITNRGDGSVARYLNDISRVALLSTEEEISLALKIQNGDKVALDKLVKTNLRFVVSVAKQYQGQGLGLSDLISEGNIGLIRAAGRFDPSKGFKFISLAVWWIRQSIILAISEQKRIIRLPGNQIVGWSKILKASLKLEQELERTPTFGEISDMTGLSIDKVADMAANGTTTLSLDANLHHNNEVSLLDTLVNGNTESPDDQLLKDSLLSDLNNILDRLPTRECLLLKYVYGLDNFPMLGMDDIAELLGLSKERVRQLKSKAIRTLSYVCREGGNSGRFNGIRR